MALLDFLGRRWVLRILWELREESLGFRALQGRCNNLSPTILSRRLNEMRSMAIVRRGESNEYALTPAGKKLCRIILPLHFWAEDWAASTASVSAPAHDRVPDNEEMKRVGFCRRLLSNHHGSGSVTAAGIYGVMAGRLWRELAYFQRRNLRFAMVSQDTF